MTEKIPNASGDMSLIEHRLDLVNRYNHMMGPPDSAIGEVQWTFISGLMGTGEAEAYVRLISYRLSVQDPADT